MAQERIPADQLDTAEQPLEPLEEELELTEEELDAMSGGVAIRRMRRCPRCGSKSVIYLYNTSTGKRYGKCKLCKWTW